MLGGLLPDSSALALFLVATVSLNLTPGPDMLYVMASSVGSGRRVGVAAALGIGGGCLVHTFAAALGLSALLMSSASLYDALRFAGAGYLIYLGLRALVGGGQAGGAVGYRRASLGSAFRQGVTTNVLNPKVAIFFLAFLPQFVDPARGDAAWQFILLGTIFNVSGTVVNSLVALAAGRLGEGLRSRPRLARAQQWFTGGVFVALGARLALAGRD
ncbi:MAG: LysE family translocator [Chloroflexota bacterium]